MNIITAVVVCLDVEVSLEILLWSLLSLVLLTDLLVK